MAQNPVGVGTEVSPSPVAYVVERGIATITLARPEAMNSLDTATKEALLEALRAASDDPAVRAVVLTGSGRAFCVGQDLREHAHNLVHHRDAVMSTVETHYNPIVELLATMPKPVVAAVNGVAAGAGAAFAFACDFRVVAASAGFNLAFAGIALSCDSGTSWSLPALVGVAKAKELLFFPRTVPATEALDLGLASSVVPDDQVLTAARDMATRLADGPTVAYGAMRQAIAFSSGHGLTESLANESRLMGVTGLSDDHGRAVPAFLAKEKPVFGGH